MTLAELLPAVRLLSVQEKLKLIRLLAEELDTAEEIAPLEPYKTYKLPTPYNSFETGAILIETLKQVDFEH
ncbi:hypothetical protein [Synechocystis sp. PCC 7509]|uniref:hypothetical protein n=1 Tax=Synechocystis sp. PCC 7509 TaxID=927677 RepID=UPI0002ABE007|nr:hypothetical protein [Synechocystis sp. PCC 7509]